MKELYAAEMLNALTARLETQNYKASDIEFSGKGFSDRMATISYTGPTKKTFTLTVRADENRSDVLQVHIEGGGLDKIIGYETETSGKLSAPSETKATESLFSHIRTSL